MPPSVVEVLGLLFLFSVSGEGGLLAIGVKVHFELGSGRNGEILRGESCT